VTRFVDRGAITAAYVGIGMAVTVAISFLLVIPIEPVYWYLTVPAGLLIGYYANQRSDRRNGPWHRIVANAAFAGAVMAVTTALLLLGVKALFFAADDGYRDPGLGGRVVIEKDDGRPVACSQGAECVYLRYVDEGRGRDLAAAGVTDAASFTAFYWNQQLATAALLLGLATGSGIAGGVLYGLFRPKSGSAALVEARST
jgi:hypothetical protein